MEPSLQLVVPDVICDVCQDNQDLDLCRDPMLNAESEQVVQGNTVKVKGDWSCRHCKSELNKGLIERKLVDLLNRRIVGYQLQDLKCKKCKMVKNSTVSRYCDCTGLFVQTIGD